MFDLQRFGRLARAQWAESWRKYAWFLAAGVLLHVVVSIIFFASGNGLGFMAFQKDGQAALYFTGLFVLAPIFAARYFLAMTHRGSALLALMRPASVFEKWLLAALTVAVLYPAAYTLAFYMIDVPDAWLAQAQAIRQHVRPGPDTRLLQEQFRAEHYRVAFAWTELRDRREGVGIVLFLGSMLGMAVFGSLYFRTVPFIKTVLSCFLIFLAALLVNVVFQSRSDLVFGYWDHRHSLSSLQEIVYPALWLAFPGLFWLAGFLALKEREIAP